MSGEADEHFRQIYEQNVATVFGFLRARVGHDTAEDLTAETFARAFQHLGTWEDRGLPIRAWLLRIALNLLIGQARRQSPSLVPLEDHHQPAEPAHDDVVNDAIEGAAALVALQRLPDHQRTVIELRYLEDLSVAETAAVMDLSPEAVRALAYRSLKALRVLHRETWGPQLTADADTR